MGSFAFVGAPLCGRPGGRQAACRNRAATQGAYGILRTAPTPQKISDAPRARPENEGAAAIPSPRRDGGQELPEVLEFQRLQQVLVETRLSRALAVLLLPVARDGDQGRAA